MALGVSPRRLEEPVASAIPLTWDWWKIRQCRAANRGSPQTEVTALLTAAAEAAISLLIYQTLPAYPHRESYDDVISKMMKRK